MTSLTIKDAAMAHIPDEMLHVADLPEISVNLTLQSRDRQNQKGETYKQLYTEINGRKYLVPQKVLEIIQGILKLKPSVSRVKVSKTGSGLATKYKVEPLD